MNAAQGSLLTTLRLFIRGLKDRAVLYVAARGFAVVLALVGGLLGRRRMSHNNGIGACGRATIVPRPEFPEHEFFEPGRQFPCRIRHASVSFYDDATNAVRSISVKLADSSFESPFDMELNTGSVALFWSAACFFKFASLRKQHYGIQYPRYYRHYPVGFAGAVDSKRRNPTSFQNQRYYSKTPFLFIGKDHVKRYAKYRVIPCDDEPETGLQQGTDRLEPWNQRTLPGETRGRNYLKQEYARRVRERGAQYRMQIQLRVASDDDDPEIFNCCRAWDESECPWLDLATIEIDRVLDWDDSNRLSFSLKNLPPTLGVIPAKSIYDYNSLNYMRAHSGLARKARLLAYRLFGMPAPIPNDDDRNT